MVLPQLIRTVLFFRFRSWAGVCSATKTHFKQANGRATIFQNIHKQADSQNAGAAIRNGRHDRCIRKARHRWAIAISSSGHHKIKRRIIRLLEMRYLVAEALDGCTGTAGSTDT
uniref:(northern house mosquito) hypothetical protein n=1 Tax=Culex pipiens TaxID=7175 RepID=A0A8D8PAC7_CULPI